MKKYKYCRFCGLELENNNCSCELSRSSKSVTIKIKCDTCKESIPKDSLFCPYCGIPQFVDGRNKNLEKELLTSPDVMKIYFGIKKKSNKVIYIKILLLMLDTITFISL